MKSGVRPIKPSRAHSNHNSIRVRVMLLMRLRTTSRAQFHGCLAIFPRVSLGLIASSLRCCARAVLAQAPTSRAASAPYPQKRKPDGDGDKHTAAPERPRRRRFPNKILIHHRDVIPKEATSPEGRGPPRPKSNFAALSGKGHEANSEFHASPLPGGSPRRRISLALLQPTPGDSTRATTRWCERIRGRF